MCKSLLKKMICPSCDKVDPMPVIPKPEIPILVMSGRTAQAEIETLGQTIMYPILLDYFQDYYYTTAEGWAEVFNYIYLVFDMPEYIAARMDCEDFGILLKGLVSALFGLNYFAFTVGDIPAGCHGFDFFRVEDGHMIIEPQSGEFFAWGERGYTPKYALL